MKVRSAPSLQRRFIVGAALAGVVFVLLLVAGASWLLSRDIHRQGNVRIADAARRSLIVVNNALEDRSRQARVLTVMPEVVSATREGLARARALGIVGRPIPELEKQFSQDRSLSVAPTTRQFLRDILPEMDAAEMLLTEANGYNAVITERSSDFVQSDEAWWKSAWSDGISPADAAYDSSAHQTTVSLGAVVRDGGTKSGVLKLAFSIAPLVKSLASASGGVRIDILDSTNRILLSSDSASTGLALAGIPTTPGDSTDAFPVTNRGVAEEAVVLHANASRWRVVAHLPTAEIAAPFRTARISLFAGAAALLGVLGTLLVAMNNFLQRRISRPATELAEAAEAVAAGDFSVELERSSADDEIGRLSRAVGAMILELRRLAATIAASAHETNTMSLEITASSEEMAASAGQIALTASDLSVQAASMAETITSLAESAASLRALADELDAGARHGVARNTALRSLALEKRAGLDASAQSLGQLADDVNASAMAIVSLGDASEEIRSFVTLVRTLARQSKLLALNAAMEAARAGVHGQGFNVVATEVRRLAAMSSDAAARTETIVNGILKGIDTSRDSAERAVSPAGEVRVATARASKSFAEIEAAVSEAEEWTASIEQTSAATSGLVGSITKRLDSLSGGTESFAAAMEEVAASSQEQSASTQEIAAAASTLGAASERLSTLVRGLKTESGNGNGKK